MVQVQQIQTITPCLWFDRNAEDAVGHYVAIFPNSRNVRVGRYGEGGPMPKGTAMMIEFELNGLRLQALNGGPHFKFSEAISLSIRCENQAEVDHYWDKLSAGGAPGRCGWLKDKFGLSWQVVPSRLGDLMSGTDPARSSRVMQAVMAMNKLDIAALERAAAGETA